MAYLTFDYLNQRSGILKEAFENRSMYNFDDFEQNRVFLSHRRRDIDIVKNVIGFLQELGGTIYVDYLDDVLPDKTNFETAAILRNRIDSCAKFILLASPNSSESKWIPWELGIGDRKGLNNVAILPLVENRDNWKEREYYQIYGSIQISQQGNWCFFTPQKSKGIKLTEWLTNSSLLLEG